MKKTTLIDDGLSSLLRELSVLSESKDGAMIADHIKDVYYDRIQVELILKKNIVAWLTGRKDWFIVFCIAILCILIIGLIFSMMGIVMFSKLVVGEDIGTRPMFLLGGLAMLSSLQSRRKTGQLLSQLSRNSFLRLRSTSVTAWIRTNLNTNPSPINTIFISTLLLLLKMTQTGRSRS